MTKAKAPNGKSTEVDKGGRPRIEIDAKQLEALVRIQATATECASVLGVSVNTLDRRVKELNDPETGELYGGFGDYYKKIAPAGKASLRRAQWSSALGGNVTMQIWLGKQELDQRDKQDHEHSGTVKHAQAIDWDSMPLDVKMQLLDALTPVDADEPTTDTGAIH